MIDVEDDEFDGWEEGDDIAVEALAKLAGLIRRIDWFGRVGTPLGRHDLVEGEAYLAQLGLPDISMILVEDWEDAAAAAENLDFNTAGWEVEEQLRASLIEEALNLYAEDELAALLQPIEAVAVQVLEEAAQGLSIRHRLEDDAFLTAAVGAGVQICHLAALVLLSGVEDSEDHPFFHKFRLFEAGRWPIGVTGSSFNIF